MPPLKVLFLCHNHPVLFPGGAETYAFELYLTLQEAPAEFDPILICRIGSNVAARRPAHPGTAWATVGTDPQQMFFHTDGQAYDSFYGTLRDADALGVHLHEFLLAHQPDIVHVQHSLFIGYDMLRQIRNTLPNVPIVYTLHEFLPICHNHGQMVRTNNGEPCMEASPRRCQECFPEVSQGDFFLRRKFIQSHLTLVDLFLAPSRFLLERYVDWGIPRDRIRFEEYGRRAAAVVPSDADDRPRNRIGFFGQLNPYKGSAVLLEAMRSLRREAACAGVHAWVHGANLELQSPPFQAQFAQLLEASADNVTFAGPYRPGDLGRLMANVDWVVVPSTWWENSPLVIQEAFLHGRPVICSDIGGMAEKVSDGRDGLHFRAGSASSLAATIQRAVTTPDLWDRLRSGIKPVYTAADHAATLTEIYRELLRRPAEAAAS